MLYSIFSTTRFMWDYDEKKMRNKSSNKQTQSTPRIITWFGHNPDLRPQCRREIFHYNQQKENTIQPRLKTTTSLRSQVEMRKYNVTSLVPNHQTNLQESLPKQSRRAQSSPWWGIVEQVNPNEHLWETLVTSLLLSLQNSPLWMRN